MKYEGVLFGIPVYSDPEIEKDVLYVVGDNFKMNYPLKKNKKPDMRFKINKMQQVFDSKHRNSFYA